jgi:hypothetical protein
MAFMMPDTGALVAPASAEIQLDAVGAAATKATIYQQLSTLKSDDTRDAEREYAVGYCKPPRHSRFKKGQSGNPRGRPAGSKNLKTLVTQALNQHIVIIEDGRPRKITKREAIANEIVNRSATADFRAVKIVLDIEGQAEPLSPETAAYSEADEKVIERLRKRFSKKDTP